MKTLTWICLLLMATFNANIMAETKPYKTREEVPKKFKWNLSDIYQDWDAWSQDLEKSKKLLEEIEAMKGKASKSASNLKKTLKQNTELSQKVNKLYAYPFLLKSVESTNTEVSGKMQQVQHFMAEYSTKLSWLTPELLKVPEKQMMEWIDSDPELEPFRFPLEKMYHNQEHTLDENKEALLSYFSQVSEAPSSIYDELANSDVDYKEVELSDGEKVKATPGTNKQVLAYNQNQEDRRKVSEAMYKVYEENKYAYAAIYNAVCQSDWAAARSRNFPTTLKAALHGKNIPENVYLNLIETVKENTEPLQRYARLRARKLGLEGNYHRYDGSLSLVNSDKKYPYDEARKTILESVAPLGDDYQQKLQKAMAEGWLDVYEYEGKRPGAFSAGVYGVHPYMLLNYSETMDDMFTLAHELGHTMHTLLSDENQPYPTHGYTIFVAEVASTFNERLLLDHLLEKTEEPEERIELLSQAIDNIVGTFYVQSMFADYELQVHKMVEKGQPVTPESLTSIFRNLFDAYYGDAVINDDFYDVIWARIHHFYGMPYYVYQYATSFAASAALYDKVMVDKEENARNAYLNLLSSGGNDFPVNQLKKAGVDTTSPETVKAVVKQLNMLLDRLEEELDKV